MNAETRSPYTHGRKPGRDECGVEHLVSTFIKDVMIMDIGTVTSLIGSLGFPIVCCIAMWTMLNKERDAHKEEMDKLNQTINNNTLALQALADRMDQHPAA